MNVFRHTVYLDRLSALPFYDAGKVAVEFGFP